MYFNEVHIGFYIAFFVIGAIIGEFLEWVNIRVVEKKRIFSKEIKNELTKKFTINASALIVAVLYVVILFKFGISNNVIENLNLIKYLILIPILISIITIDYKNKIISNRLLLTVFETGLIFAFLYSLDSVFVAKDYLVASIVGFVIFASIALLGRLIAGKEAMGMGDIKLLACLGLYFGTALTLSISVISFIIAGIACIIIIALKKKESEYITLGPCIGIAAIICILVPENVIISVLLTIFTLGRYKG